MNTCRGCGADISHKAAQARWCSNACRAASTYTPREKIAGTCVECGGSFEGPKGKIFCSKKCSLRHQNRDRSGEYDPETRRDAMRAYQQEKKRKKIPEATKKRIFERDGYVCQLCGEICDGTGKRDPRMPSIDHITPWIETQDDSDENLRTTHLECNRKRRWS